VLSLSKKVATAILSMFLAFISIAAGFTLFTGIVVVFDSFTFLQISATPHIYNQQTGSYKITNYCT